MPLLGGDTHQSPIMDETAIRRVLSGIYSGGKKLDDILESHFAPDGVLKTPVMICKGKNKLSDVFNLTTSIFHVTPVLTSFTSSTDSTVIRYNLHLEPKLPIRLPSLISSFLPFTFNFPMLAVLNLDHVRDERGQMKWMVTQFEEIWTVELILGLIPVLNILVGTSWRGDMIKKMIGNAVAKGAHTGLNLVQGLTGTVKAGTSQMAAGLTPVTEDVGMVSMKQ
ncbi:hypothetical protein BKA69DRAFT_1063489 [Paraphysoderma sedebokerense]|nr:hypothetical protein BKA69DRAFT_1063489 [Paraphysoderma sedebokerense]